MRRSAWLVLGLAMVSGAGCSGTFLPNFCRPGTIQEQREVFSRFDPYPQPISSGPDIVGARPRGMNVPMAEQAWLNKNEFAPLPSGPPKPLVTPGATATTTAFPPTTAVPATGVPGTVCLPAVPAG